MDKFLKIVLTTSIIGLYVICFVNIYIRLNDNYRIGKNEEHIEQLYQEVDKIEYALETHPDTISIVNKIEVSYK